MFVIKMTNNIESSSMKISRSELYIHINDGVCIYVYFKAGVFMCIYVNFKAGVFSCLIIKLSLSVYLQ